MRNNGNDRLPLPPGLPAIRRRPHRDDRAGRRGWRHGDYGGGHRFRRAAARHRVAHDGACDAGRCEAWPKIYATTGIHPTSASHATPELLDEVEQLSHDPRVLAIGEIGMDFHHGVPADVQETVFIRQMEIARAARKPIVIHSRDAWPETLSLLQAHWASSGLGGILHCFSGDMGVARAGMDMGFLISIAGPVTFPKAGDLRDVARQIPLDRLLIETDAPYLAPVPHRGKRNEPAFVAEVCRCLAELHKVSPAEMAAQTTANFHRLLIH